MSNPRNMSFMSSAVFWGTLIILIGISVILKAVFGINIPLFRIVFGFFLVYLGIKMIAGGFFRTHFSHSAVFNESRINYDESQREYNIIFGSGTVDLFKMDTSHENKKFEVNVVFGNGTVILNDSVPILVEMNSAFGAATALDKSINALGKTTFTTSAYKANEPYTFIKASVVFGKLNIETKKW